LFQPFDSANIQPFFKPPKFFCTFFKKFFISCKINPYSPLYNIIKVRTRARKSMKEKMKTQKTAPATTCKRWMVLFISA